MGIFDRFRSKKPESDESTISIDAAAASAVNPSLDLTEATPSPSDAAAKILGFNSQESERLYNPYEGLGSALDRRDVKAPFRLPKEPEFLFTEEAFVHQRSWSENLTYYTGTCYLLGAISGGGLGAYRALNQPIELATAAGMPSQRIRLNQLLNTSGKLGRSAGNSLGVLGLLFSSSESFLRYMNDGRVPEELATVGAGAATGAVYRSVRGPRQAAAAAAVGTLLATLLLGGRRYINSGL